MNAPEGIRRLAISIRWAGDGFGALFAAIGIALLFAETGLGILVLIMAALCIIAGRILSWIIFGFAVPRSEGDPSQRGR